MVARPAPVQLQDSPRRADPEGVSARRVPHAVTSLSVGHDARHSGNDGCHSSFIRGSDPQVPLRDATGSPDPQAPFRTLTGVRFRPVDESASLIGAGEL